MEQLIRAGPRLLVAGAIAAGLAIPADRAAGQSTFFAGYTLGCFYNTAISSGCTPTANASLTGGALSFTGGTFGGSTTNGVLNFAPVTWWTHTGVIVGGGNLGTLELGKLPGFVYTGWNFMLQVVFSHPLTNQNLFLATLDGTITHKKPALLGDIDIAFGDPQKFGANGQYGVGISSFSDLKPEQSHSIGGQMTTTPEPITMLLFGTGLAGVGLARRRRNRIEKADLI